MNSIRMILCVAYVIAAAFFAGAARADSEAMNVVHTFYSKSHKVFAKSIPTELFGQKGTTKVFRIKAKNKPVLIAQYPWYTHGICLGGKGDDTLIRFGPWPIGHTPRADQMELGIYRNGKLIRKYSTLQIHQMGSGIRQSVSHYMIFDYEKPHFRQIVGRGRRPGYYVFEIKGISGKVFQFNLDTGEVKALSAPSAKARKT